MIARVVQHRDSGRETLLLGLTTEDVACLVDGKPLAVSRDEIDGTPGSALIFHGADADALKKQTAEILIRDGQHVLRSEEAAR